MNTDEFRYDFIYNAIKDIDGIVIVDDVAKLSNSDYAVFIKVGEQSNENRFSEGRVINGSGSFEMSLWYQNKNERKTGYIAEIRNKLGNLKDNMIVKIAKQTYPIVYKNTIDTVSNFQMIIYGYKGFYDIDDLTEHIGLKETRLYFDYELTYL